MNQHTFITDREDDDDDSSTKDKREDKRENKYSKECLSKDKVYYF